MRLQGVIKEDLSHGKATLTTQCPVCKKTSVVETTEAALGRYRAGELLHRAFSDLSATEREMLLTGYCCECWDDLFQGDEDEF